MHVQGAAAALSGQAMGAVPLVEDQIACAVGRRPPRRQQACRVQHLHAQQMPHHQGAQPEHAGDAAAAQEIVQGIVDRPRLLLRARQAVEIIQHVGAVGVALGIQLPATAQFAEEQRQPPPQQETFVVNDKGLEARSGIWSIQSLNWGKKWRTVRARMGPMFRVVPGGVCGW